MLTKKLEIEQVEEFFFQHKTIEKHFISSVIFMKVYFLEDLLKAAPENIYRLKANTSVQKYETLNTNISDYSQKLI